MPRMNKFKFEILRQINYNACNGDVVWYELWKSCLVALAWSFKTMRFLCWLFIVVFFLIDVRAGGEEKDFGLFSPIESEALIIRPSTMLIKPRQSVAEIFSYEKLVDARDIPEMLEIFFVRNGHDYADVQAVVLDAIDGMDNVAFKVICEGFLLKCPNLRLISLSENNRGMLTKDIATTSCNLMRCSPRCIIDLSETEIRNKDVFPLFEEVQRLTGVDYESFAGRFIFLRKNYLWDAQNRVACYHEKAKTGLLMQDWWQRHKDFYSKSPVGLGASAKETGVIDLPYPINLVFGVYAHHTSEEEEVDFTSEFAKLSLNTAECSDDEECNLTECSSVDSSYLSRYMLDKYGDNLANVRYIWLEDCGVDAYVLHHLYEGFLCRCVDLRLLSLAGNAIGSEVVPELIRIWSTSRHCIFVLANTTFGGLQSGRELFKKIKELLPDDKTYEEAVQKLVLMDECTLRLPSYLDNGKAWAEEKLWDSTWQERHREFWKTYASKRDRIPESLVSQDACE